MSDAAQLRPALSLEAQILTIAACLRARGVTRAGMRLFIHEDRIEPMAALFAKYGECFEPELGTVGVLACRKCMPQLESLQRRGWPLDEIERWLAIEACS